MNIDDIDDIEPSVKSTTIKNYFADVSTNQSVSLLEYWNRLDFHVFDGSKRQFTYPRGKVLQRLIKLEGY